MGDKRETDGLSDTLEQLFPIPEALADGTLWAERVEIEMPLEMIVRTGDEGIEGIETSAPTQTFSTSLLPTFHRMRVVLVAEEPGQNEADGGR